AHAVVTGAKRTANDGGDLRHASGRYRRHQLGTVLGDAAGLIFAPDHEAGDVLQEEKRDLALAAELNEVRALQRRFREEHAVIGENAHRHTVKMRKAGHQSGAVVLLEFVELGAIDQTGNHLAGVISLAQVGGHDPVKFMWIIKRRNHFLKRQLQDLLPIQVSDDAADDRKRVAVILRIMVGYAGFARVEIGTAQFLRAYHL